jgi:hypothetical protein
MKQQVAEALENAKASLDQALAGLEKITEFEAETVAYTAHKLKNYLAVVGAASELLEVYLAGHPVEKIGGSIGCESSPGHGATFYVRLPAFRNNPGDLK